MARSQQLETQIANLTSELEETRTFLEAETFNKQQLEQEVSDLKKTFNAERDKLEKVGRPASCSH
jgi:predicted  nucleic acid-binding Zn-ribbon protein